MYAAANAIISLEGNIACWRKWQIHKQHSKQLCREDAAALCVYQTVLQRKTQSQQSSA